MRGMPKPVSSAAASRVHRVEHHSVDLPDEVPVLFLVSQVVFPFGASQIRVRTPQNLALIESLGEDDLFAVAFAPGAEPEAVTADDLGHVGIVARVIARLKLPDGSEQITIQGLERVHIDEIIRDTPFLVGRAACVLEHLGDPTRADSAILRLLEMAQELAGLGAGVQPEHVAVLQTNVEDPGRFADLMAAMSGLDPVHQRRVLEKVDVVERLEYLGGLVRGHLEYARVKNETDARVRTEIEATQREYYLRRQMKVLKEELGENSREEEAANAALTRAEALDLPEAAGRAVRGEIERLRETNPASAEYAVIQNYLDWMLSLPWNLRCPTHLEIDDVRKQLDAEHFGLQLPKERILEYLAVRKLQPDAPAPILCFLGPPGTGKTSLAQSIARATGRKLGRLSVGGVRDESTIRGHRRTYVGAMPGRIIQALRRAECANPLLVIDEVDKLGSGPQGDPSAALLEVLDPEQNATFTDHFLDVAFDLSRVFFIATANDWWEIPAALRDRMEVIELSSYVESEKVEIARRHLLPQLLERTGLPHAVRFDVAALREIVRGYTSEAGVRDLSRKIQSVLRKLALQVASGRKIPKRIKKADVTRLLGPRPIPASARRRKDEIGVVNGLAWTNIGGDVLLIEGLVVPGEGSVQITGSLGEVMKESVAASLTYVRSRARDLGIPHEVFGAVDVHLHFPEGSTPKDGPSAGVGISVALASLYTRRPVRKDVAMTGEVTLRGGVLPIGGLKEKLAAAARLGIRHVIVPKANEGDLYWVRPEVLSKLEIHPVEHMDEVFEIALRKHPRSG